MRFAAALIGCVVGGCLASELRRRRSAGCSSAERAARRDPDDQGAA